MHAPVVVAKVEKTEEERRRELKHRLELEKIKEEAKRKKKKAGLL